MNGGDWRLEIAPGEWVNPIYVVSVREVAPGSWRLKTSDGELHKVTDPAVVELLAHGGEREVWD